MNEYNHHRIIDKFVTDSNLSGNKNLFYRTSDFTDSCEPKHQNNYYFYHFYYDIRIKGGNTITLSRVDEDTNKYEESMRHCGDYSGSEYKMSFSTKTDKKEFFSIINDRRKPTYIGEHFIENQSDNVAFLHAMGAESEDKSKSLNLFKEHLKKCFAEYLFVKEDDRALFMLGIAFHGIMDSFTPSHMDFQNYTNQDMALHAQGDVVPIRDNKEKVEFVPGQYDKDNNAASMLLSYGVKWFNSNNYINATEYMMLKIFLYISKLQHKNGTSEDIETFWKKLENKTLHQVEEKLKDYKYGEEAYVYSDTVIKVLNNIYNYLSKERDNCKTYQNYKTSKKKLDVVVEIWKKEYDKMESIRDSHIKLGLYKKDWSISRLTNPVDQICDGTTTLIEGTKDFADEAVKQPQKLIEENQKIIPNFNLYHNPGGGKI